MIVPHTCVCVCVVCALVCVALPYTLVIVPHTYNCFMVFVCERERERERVSVTHVCTCMHFIVSRYDRSRTCKRVHRLVFNFFIFFLGAGGSSWHDGGGSRTRVYGVCTISHLAGV